MDDDDEEEDSEADLLPARDAAAGAEERQFELMVGDEVTDECLMQQLAGAQGYSSLLGDWLEGVGTLVDPAQGTQPA